MMSRPQWWGEGVDRVRGKLAAVQGADRLSERLLTVVAVALWARWSAVTDEQAEAVVLALDHAQIYERAGLLRERTGEERPAGRRSGADR